MEKGDALDDLMHVERHRAEGDGATQVEEHLDDAVDPRHFLEEDRGVLAPARLVAQLPLHELHRAADGREGIANLVGEAHCHLACRGQRLSPPELGFELVEARDVAHYRYRGLDGAAPAGQGRGDHAHPHGPTVRRLDHRRRLGPALSRGEGVREVPHQ